MTRCKFTCVSVTIRGLGENSQKEFEFAPVTSGSDENKSFWKWTPSGSLKFSCLNPSVNFEIGREYYLELSLVELPQPKEEPQAMPAEPEETEVKKKKK